MEKLKLKGSRVERTGKSIDHCGYCNTDAASITEGLWAFTLNVMDYQNLIDHGWRRSGRYIYKPINSVTCCPLYTIRCDVSSFHLSKSHKKVLRNMNKYLFKGKLMQKLSETKRIEWNNYLVTNLDSNSATWKTRTNSKDKFLQANPVGRFPAPYNINDLYNIDDATSRSPIKQSKERRCSKEAELMDVLSLPGGSSIKTDERRKVRAHAERRKTDSFSEGFNSRKSSLADSVVTIGGTHRKKAKVIRRENKVNKLLSKGYSEKEIHEKLHNSKVTPQASSNLEDFMSQLDSGVNKLLIKLIRTSPKSKEYEETEQESFQLYRKYQMAVHGDKANEITKSSFENFLVDSPLEPIDAESNLGCNFGSFHQQYWINGILIAVGVIDILPYCVSSVYFYYDPDFKVLSLGTYGALSEIFFSKSLKLANPMIQYYYMGYYIHSCPKMRYKGNFSPSYLLCPENYTWHPIEKCLPKLDVSKYSRFSEES